MYGKALAEYMADRSNFFVISTDFCHWGTRWAQLLSTRNYLVRGICNHEREECCCRFDYTFHEKRLGPIHKCVQLCISTSGGTCC